MNNRLILIILICTTFFSCKDEIESTSISISIFNESEKDFYMDFEKNNSIHDTINACVKGNSICSKSLISHEYNGQVFNRFDQVGFDSLIQSLRIYTLNEQDQKSYYGGDSLYVRQLINWTYTFTSEPQFGYQRHEYDLIISE